MLAATHSRTVNARTSPLRWTSKRDRERTTGKQISKRSGHPSRRGRRRNDGARDARIRFSSKSCRTIRHGRRRARACRPNSFRREAARTSSRLATFAQTIKRTTPQTAIRMRNGAPIALCAPKCPSESGRMATPMPRLVSGRSLAIAATARRLRRGPAPRGLRALGARRRTARATSDRAASIRAWHSVAAP